MALPARLRKETPALRIPGRRLQNAQRWEPGTGRWIGLDAMRRETGEAQAKFTGGMSREWGREGNERAIVTGNHFYIEKNPGGEQWADQLGRMLLAELESSGSGAFFA